MTRHYSARSMNRAQYLPAGQPNAHSMPFRDPMKVRDGIIPSCLPGGLKSLDWLDPSAPLFRTDRALFSAGNFIGRKSPIPQGTLSRRPGVTILCDSGGLQYGRANSQWREDESRKWVLNFVERYGDEAITLDIPTLAIDEPKSVFGSFDDCLKVTLDNNAYFHDHRTRKDLRMLCALQGRDKDEAARWYNAMKERPFEGWAFAGDLRTDYFHMGSMLVRMIADGMLTPERNRIHVLGVSRLVDAVMLSAFQRALRKRLKDGELQITYDTSSPSQMAKTGKAFGHPWLSKKQFSMSSIRPPSGHAHADTSYPFPGASSKLAESMTSPDLCVKSYSRAHGWDTLGTEMVVHHNLEALLRGISDANDILEMPSFLAEEVAPPHVVRAYNAVKTMFDYPDPVGHLTRFKRDLIKLRAKAGKTLVSDDEEDENALGAVQVAGAAKQP